MLIIESHAVYNVSYNSHLAYLSITNLLLRCCISRNIPKKYFTFHLQEKKLVYEGRSFALFVFLYSGFLQNATIKISTSIITFLAIYRYFAIVHFVCINSYMRSKCVIYSVICIFVIWICLMMPYVWSYKTLSFTCPPGTEYILIKTDVFIEDEALRTTFNYIHAILGFFIPVSIMAFCNIRLITVVHTSKQRANLARLARQGATTSQMHQNGTKMNITLIMIIVAFFFLVLPGELLLFIQDNLGLKEMSVETLHTILHVCNILQATNMAFNFALYCCVNSTFRRTFTKLMDKMCSCVCISHHKGFTLADTSVSMRERHRINSADTSVTLGVQCRANRRETKPMIVDESAV